MTKSLRMIQVLDTASGQGRHCEAALCLIHIFVYGVPFHTVVSKDAALSVENGAAICKY